MKTKPKQAKNNRETIGFGFRKESDLPFHEAVGRVRAPLADEGFGRLREIGLKENGGSAKRRQFEI